LTGQNGWEAGAFINAEQICVSHLSCRLLAS